jgi:hypothetical protein
MDKRRSTRALFRAACAALALAVPACWDDVGDSSSGPPAPTWVGIDDYDAKVDDAAAWLGGEIECPDCTASDWQYQSCPAIECPSTEGSDVRWTNTSSGAEGAATHGTVAQCHCPWPWFYGYCYTACSHVWWATVPLGYGDNAIVVSAVVPGYDEGTDSILIRRVPPPPAWLASQPGPGQLLLSWSGVGDATSYNLYWSTTAYGWSSYCTKIEGVTSPFLHAGLAGGTPHYYFVTTLVGDAESFDSLRLEATPQ